jgi:DegV family protein with EDD domain
MLDHPDKVHLFESNMAAFGNEHLLLRMMDYINEDLPKDEIISKMEHNISTAKLVMTSLDLVSLIKSGRLSKTKGIIGSLLRVKPVIKMEAGKLDLFHVARTTKKAVVLQLEYMKEELKSGYDKLFVRICNHNSLELANKMREEVQLYFKDAIVTFGEYVGPVFNVHIGPKGFGLAWHTE